MNLGSFRILLPFFGTSWGVGVPNSGIFNSFHNGVGFGTGTVVRHCVWPSKTGPISCPESSVTTNKRCETSHKREDLIYTAAAAWNLAVINLAENDSNKSCKTKYGLVSCKCEIIFDRWQPKLNSPNIFYHRTNKQNFIKVNHYFEETQNADRQIGLPIIYETRVLFYVRQLKIPQDILTKFRYNISATKFEDRNLEFYTRWKLDT